MSRKVIPCMYNQSNPIVIRFGDIKIEYATTESTIIKELLDKGEELILFRTGSVESLKAKIRSLENLTPEESSFIEKLSALLG